MTKKELPPIVEVFDVDSATKLWRTGLYRSPEYDKNKSAYIFIMRAKKK